MTEYQPYGVRLRRRALQLHGGRIAGKGEYVGLDQVPLSEVLVYRTLVLRRSPTASRPPSPFRLVWRGRWYDVWQRQPGPLVLSHVPLGSSVEPAGIPSCRSVRRLATTGRLIAPSRRLNLIWPLGPSIGDRGAKTLAIRVQRPGRYRLWVGGSVRGRLTAAVNGLRVGSVSSRLQNAGQWLDLGTVQLAPGTHSVSLVVDAPPLEPGVGGGGFGLGPLLLQPESKLVLARPLRADTFCGKSLDWVEALAR